MNVPEGVKVYSGTHKYKAGDPLPANLKALEKKLDKTTKQPSFDNKSGSKDSGR